MWFGFYEDENCEGKWKEVQYEGVREFYTYCKHQRHNNMIYTIKRWDNNFKKRKEQKEIAESAKNSENQQQNHSENIKIQLLMEVKTASQQETSLANSHTITIKPTIHEKQG